MDQDITKLEARLKALEDNQIKTIMTFNGDTNVLRSVQRSLSTDPDALIDIPMKWGVGTMSGGRLYVTDARIKATSTAVAIRGNSSNGAGTFAQLASAYSTTSTWVFFESSFSTTWDIYYIIIF